MPSLTGSSLKEKIKRLITVIYVNYVLLPHLKELRKEEVSHNVPKEPCRIISKDWYRIQQALHEKNHNTIH
jgi:hypothetical protein